MSREKPSQERDDVLRRMLRTPPARHKPVGKRKKFTPDTLAKEIKKNPQLLTDLGRELGQDEDKPPDD